jgi:EPS-associated MarR family transcriptional regulator
MVEHNVKEDILNILRLLSSDTGANQRDLSARLGFSLGKTNYLLRSLVKIGALEIKNFTVRENKLKKIQYMLTRKGWEQKLQLTLFFLKKKETEYLVLKKEAEEIKHVKG